jgi:hypothetical protein
MRQSDINNWFTYHAPSGDQLKHYEVIRAGAKMLAEDFNDAVPDCADKTAAMRKLRETVMAMNLAIACYEKPTIESLQAILDSPESHAVQINSDGSISAE